MPVNPDLLGRTFPPTAPVAVTAEWVERFAAAVHATDPAAQVAPPTFAIVVQQAALDALLAEPGTGIELRNVVHGEQRFRYDRGIVAGDELTGALTVTGLRALGGGTMLTAETRITDAGGEAVATAISMLVIGGGE